MTGEQKVSPARYPLKILAVFALAFTLQGMTLAVFQGGRHARKTEQRGAQSLWTGAQVRATEIFSVTNTDDTGPGSLRQAILDANESPGFDEIRFLFTEPVTATLSSSLVITDPVSIGAHYGSYTDTTPGWFSVDAGHMSEDVLVVSDAPMTSIQRLRLINIAGGYGIRVSGASGGTAIISNTIQTGLGGILLDNTSHVTLTHNVILDMVETAVEVRNSNMLWVQENQIRAGDTGIRLLDGVSEASIISNTVFGATRAGTIGIMAAGSPAPTGVVIRGNRFTDTLPVEFGPGVNNGFPAPEIIDAYLPITGTNSLDFSARSPADPFSYTYPLSMDVYRVRDGSYTPLGQTVTYHALDWPAADVFSVKFTDTGVLATDQLALIATTANPSSSEFSVPISFTLRPPADDDGDGVGNADDQCPGTVIPEANVPSVKLGVNRFALVNDDLDFETTLPRGSGPGRSYSTTETAGCSCEQIVDEFGLGGGHMFFGCSISAMDGWVDSITGVSKQGATAEDADAATAAETFVLEQNYPNPFNPTTRINFQVPDQRHVMLSVYDILGRVVITIVNEELDQGFHQVQWDGRNAQGHPVTSGLYLYRIEAGDFSAEKTMSLLR
jgi:parallel beta-helix repeat protein